MITSSVRETNIREFPLVKKGKVRDVYDLGDNYLFIATDRLSAFDVVMPDPIPEKGRVLTQISLFWFKVMEPIIGNHIVTSDFNDFPPELKAYKEMLDGRSMIVKKADPLPVECVVRGYISGSGWSSYKKSGEICGIPLPVGLIESERLPEPIFTPSTKAELGDHDENISFDQAVKLVGPEIAEKVKRLSIEIYKKGVEVAESLGIIVADTKFEFGMLNGELILIDEVLTPDSSRFWPKSDYRPGGSPKSYDKQYVRDYLSGLDWDKNPPGPSFPDFVIENTKTKYLEIMNLFLSSSYAR
ncbi:phosphoribosylaminoimidazolesuccinocarboxamide synthase [Desulforegula conservatrix]|uniref:phosphoribosylaminoimidazolesuccinocarboxamide synthase n=1 Tax=Desulforegula conservatrix TaxID=153026 RepID=UPI00040DF037|nr:phosphoribosylaminoimidazolesuccinocarboxamide synthase [Desulforegula conservatrix]